MKNRAVVSAADQTIIVHVPFKFKKRGGRKLVVTPDGAAWAPRHVNRLDARADGAVLPYEQVAPRIRESLEKMPRGCGTSVQLAEHPREAEVPSEYRTWATCSPRPSGQPGGGSTAESNPRLGGDGFAWISDGYGRVAGRRGTISVRHGRLATVAAASSTSRTEWPRPVPRSILQEGAPSRSRESIRT